VSTRTLRVGVDHQTIASAVRSARSGEVVEVAAGTYREDFLELDRPIELRAAGGPGTVRLRSSDLGVPALTVRANATVRGITIAMDKNAYSEALSITGEGVTAVIEECLISSPNEHAIVVTDGATATLRGCRIEEVNAGLRVRQAVCLLERCEIIRPGFRAIEVQERGRVTLVDCTLSGTDYTLVNVSGAGASIDLTRCQIDGGHTYSAIQVDPQGSATVTDCRITGTESSAIHVDGREAHVTVTDTRIEDVNGNGITVYRGRLELRGSVLRNLAKEGLDLVSCTAVVEDVQIDGSGWRGIVVDEAEGRFVRCQITGPRRDGVTVAWSGEGVFFEDCTVSGADGSGFDLGGVQATLTGCQAHDNTGPGFYRAGEAKLTGCASHRNGEPDR
jgi:hypothetical protein